MSNYNAIAVQKAIDASNRRGPKISRREAALIHALLRGRRPPPKPTRTK